MTDRLSNLGGAPPTLLCRLADPMFASCSVRLAAGAVVGATDLQGATALHHAARKGVAGLVRQLLGAGAAIGLQPGYMGLQLGVHRVTRSCSAQVLRWTLRRARRGARHCSWRRGMASYVRCRHSTIVSQSM